MDYQSCYKSNIDQCIDQLPLAMAYVPMQSFGKVYDLATGFQKGTIFPDLYKPFLGAGGTSCCK